MLESFWKKILVVLDDLHIKVLHPWQLILIIKAVAFLLGFKNIVYLLIVELQVSHTPNFVISQVVIPAILRFCFRSKFHDFEKKKKNEFSENFQNFVLDFLKKNLVESFLFMYSRCHLIYSYSIQKRQSISIFFINEKLGKPASL